MLSQEKPMTGDKMKRRMRLHYKVSDSKSYYAKYIYDNNNNNECKKHARKCL